ncbi:hypothetical protein GCM10009830_14200 [Glycomyces endophyticus]|uniref:Uncharacterized protein n=1 Tax=Glycomyces endophyticus TaxID=480996 RepID=A0ABN2GDN1_9ACTN
MISQAVAMCSCGYLPIFMWYPAFLVTIASSLPPFPGIEVLLIVVPVGVIVYATVTNTWLGRGDRRGRSAVAAGLLVLVALAAAASMNATAEGFEILAVAASAGPSILLQGLAFIRLRSAAAEQWFRDCESFASGTGPDPEP